MTRASFARKLRRHPKVVDLAARRRERDERLEAMRNLRKLVGYYTRADQKPEEPDYDPPHEGPCPVCGLEIALDDVRTASIIWASKAGKNQRKLSLFYRLHRTCHDQMSGEDRDLLDLSVLSFGDVIAREIGIQVDRPRK